MSTSAISVNPSTTSPLHVADPSDDVPFASASSSTTSPLLRFPQELCDAIIDQFGPRKRVDGSNYGWIVQSWALKQCALVCKRWTPRAQRLLFRCVHLSSLRSLRALEAQLVMKEEHYAVVRVMMVKREAAAQGYPVYTLLAAAAADLAGKCANLRELELDGFGETGLFDRSYREADRYLAFDAPAHSVLFREAFRAVRVVNLHWMSFLSGADFVEFVRSFTALEELVCNNVEVKQSSDLQKIGAMISQQRTGSLFGRLRALYMVRHRTLLRHRGQT